MKFSRKLKYWLKKKESKAPLSFYENAYDYVKKYPQNTIKQVIPAEISKLKSPIPIQSKTKKQIKAITSINYLEDFILTIKNGRVWGEEGVVITHDNKLLKDKISYSDMQNHRAYYNYKIPKSMYLNGNIATISSQWSYGFYHWFLEIIPRLYLLEMSNIKIDKYLINKPTKKFQQEFLELFDIDKEKFIYTNDETHIEAKNLIVPSLNGFCGNPAPWVLRFYKDKLNLTSDNNLPEKIYISRKNVAQRKIVNENDLIPMLEKYGYKTINLEDYSIIDQFKFFASAKSIISPHGAGLSNIIFCQKDSKLIEIYHPDYMNLIYYKLSQLAEMEYYYFIGENAGKIEDQNIYVDINKLEIAL